MKRFADLYDALDSTPSTLAKVAALVRYFQEAPPADAAWALYFLTGRKLKRLLPTKLLVTWTLELTALPEWLFAESYAVVGDLAETISLLLDTTQPSASADLPLATWMATRIVPLKKLAPEAQREAVLRYWRELSRRELYLVNKLLTGELRVGVSATLVLRAIAQVTGLPAATIAHRAMGTWEPTPEAFQALIQPDAMSDDVSRPYPFYLASPLETEPQALGPREAWQVEWKWDGIRGQLLRRTGQTFLWSRGEELITERFPEILAAAQALPDGTVLDGEVLAYEGGHPLPFARLQRRIGRQKPTPTVLREAPAVFMAYDLLEFAGADLRELPLLERRAKLEALLLPLGQPFVLSEVLHESTWASLASLREEARARNVEGMMLKRTDSPYKTGRKRGDWWKWKIDPFSVDVVLLYAHPGSGKRANLFTDYTFAVWQGETLVPVAKAYSGLTDEEIGVLDKWIRGHTLERFGPVRAVEPSQVFELHFEAIAPSPRHKSGIALRFPRIARWRNDKPANEADTLETLQKLIPASATSDSDE